jgi:Sulfotransferase domain
VTLPTFFIIGAAKAGTTSLHHYLDQHPEIQMSAVKEPNFFTGPPNGIPHPIGKVVSRRDEYEGLFDAAFGVRGEASVGYSNHPRRKGVPAAIRELVPKAKFVYLVRDPVARTVSQYRYRVAMEGERRPIEEALSDLSDPYSVYLCPSRYASQLELYLDEFPEDRMLVVDQADLLERRRTTLREIFAFLEVDADVDSSAFAEELNTNTRNRAYPLGYVRLRKRVAASPLRLLPRGLRRSLRGSLERVAWSSVPPVGLDDRLRQALEELYAPEVARLRAFTGKSFPTWSL